MRSTGGGLNAASVMLGRGVAQIDCLRFMPPRTSGPGGRRIAFVLLKRRTSSPP
ncbi:hypothetical protein [Saccharopolyspora shandongensis]|uniref:hypothetical protein n=1 Tax=Saccharopolyspora shandongensis TaxID=418495 RepID=UPI0033C7FFE7